MKYKPGYFKRLLKEQNLPPYPYGNEPDFSIGCPEGSTAYNFWSNNNPSAAEYCADSVPIVNSNGSVSYIPHTEYCPSVLNGGTGWYQDENNQNQNSTPFQSDGSNTCACANYCIDDYEDNIEPEEEEETTYVLHKWKFSNPGGCPIEGINPSTITMEGVFGGTFNGLVVTPNENGIIPYESNLEFYQSVGSPSVGQIIMVSTPGEGLGNDSGPRCVEYLGTHETNNTSFFGNNEYVSQGDSGIIANIPSLFISGPYSDCESCLAEEETTEPEDEETYTDGTYTYTCADPFETFSPELQNNLCNSFYEGQGTISDESWSQLLNVVGMDGQCCPDQETTDDEEEEIEPFISPCDKVNGLPEYDYDKFCGNLDPNSLQGGSTGICDSPEDYQWPLDIGQGIVFELSHCECCRDKGPELPKPKEGGPLKESVKKRLQKLAGIITEQNKTPDKGADATSPSVDKVVINHPDKFDKVTTINPQTDPDAILNPVDCCTEFESLLTTYDQAIEEYLEAQYYYDIVYGGAVVSVDGFGPWVNSFDFDGDYESVMGTITFGNGMVGQPGTDWAGPWGSLVWTPAPERPFPINGNGVSSLLNNVDGEWAFSALIAQGSCFNPNIPSSILGCIGDHNEAHAYLLNTSPNIVGILQDTYYAAVDAYDAVSPLVQEGCCEELAPRVQGVQDLPAIKPLPKFQ